MKASRKLLRFIGTMSDQEQSNLMDAVTKSDKEFSNLHTIHLANKLETIGEWEQAAIQWASIRRSQDAYLCMQIADKVKERRDNE